MSKPITLYTVGTPNGIPISVALHELGVEYNLRPISFKENEQKSEWFLKINPNGRIPAIVDHKNSDFAVFETSAILLYLGQHYDPEHKLSYDPIKDPNLYSEVVQWLCFAHGGIGPMQGQLHHFRSAAPEKIPYGIKRYYDETKRLYSVIEKRLESTGWLVGGRFTIADIKALLTHHNLALGMDIFPNSQYIAPELLYRINGGHRAEIDMNEFPNIQAWLERIKARPAVEHVLTA